jgi:hypothetical protein
VFSELAYQLLATIARLTWSLFASPWFYAVAALAAMAAYAEFR